MSAGPWRAFVGPWDDGDPDPDWVSYDATFPTWEQAREALLIRLRPFLGDECRTCRRDGSMAVDELTAWPAGAPFEASVEGEDYVLALATGQPAVASVPSGNVWVDMGYVNEEAAG